MDRGRESLASGEEEGFFFSMRRKRVQRPGFFCLLCIGMDGWKGVVW